MPPNHADETDAPSFQHKAGMNFRSEPERVARRWPGRRSIAAAWLGLGLALITPAHGIQGIQLCWLGSMAIPCPGCGLTRSLSCALRGMLRESWHYHPFGWFILVLFGCLAAQSLLPDRCRQQIGDFIQARAAAFNSLSLAFIALFIGYGAIRALVHLAAAH